MKKIKTKLITAVINLCIVFLLSCSSDDGSIPDGPQDPLVDVRDNQTYKTVAINSKIWMAENLNYAADKSKCYEDSDSNCAIYGRLYDWVTARNACPTGWHLPDEKEWTKLAVATGNNGYEAAIKLRATSGWNSGNGTDDYGFSALPGGALGQASPYSPDLSFLDIGNGGYWWSTEEIEYAGDILGKGMAMIPQFDAIAILASNKSYMLSVRCIKN
jgi:uncharacterized protein (TIGR02145 family)